MALTAHNINTCILQEDCKESISYPMNPKSRGRAESKSILTEIGVETSVQSPLPPYFKSTLMPAQDRLGSFLEHLSIHQQETSCCCSFSREQIVDGILVGNSESKCDNENSDCDSINDMHIMQTNFHQLYSCMYYYENMTSREARKLLRTKPTGMFLLRDSSDPKYLFSLSVKTERGTTSVRIEYLDGKFRLDCEDNIRDLMPGFPSVVQMVDYYGDLSDRDSKRQCRWLESSGRKDVLVRLLEPCIRSVSSLQHICRLTINRSIGKKDIGESVSLLPLPNRMKDFIHSYPFKR